MLVGLFLFVLLAHGAWYLVERPPTAFMDSDGYIRALRVEDLWRGGGWFDHAVPRANAPYGDVTHWTRPLDVLISLLALPFVPFLGIKQAIFWGGAISGPLLHGATAVVLAWAALPLVGRTAAALAAIATIAQYGLMSYGALFRGDHHILYACLAAVEFGFAIRALDRDRPADWNSFFAGLAAAGGVWIGVEGMAFAFLTLGAFGLAWLSGDDRPDAPKALRFNIGLIVGEMGALAIESGPGFSVVEYDWISIIHVILSALVLLFFLAVRWSAARGAMRRPTARVAAASAGAALALGAWVLMFPKVLRGPLSDIEPEYVKFILSNILELTPGYRLELFPAALGAAIMAAAWLAWRLRREKSSRWFFSWIYVGICVAMFGALTAWWVRWTIYAGLFSCLVMGDMIAAITERIAARKIAPLAREMGTAAVVALVLLGPLAATYAIEATIKATEKKAERNWAKTCSSTVLADLLASPPWADRPRTVLAGMAYGAEILYRTPHRVIAMPYRSAQAWSDTFKAFAAKDDAPVREIVGRRNIELIAICPGYPNEGLSAQSHAADGFYARLTAQPPDWLREVPLSGDAAAFRLFEVQSSMLAK